MKSTFKPEIQWWDIAKVIPYALNTKNHPKEQIAQLCSGIAEFGWDVPIVVDADGIIIKGHGRRLAALQLGLLSVPVIVRTDLSEAQKKAARIHDNKSAESSWDLDALKVEIEALGEMNFDLAFTGFSEDEIGDLWLEETPTKEGGEFQPPENQPPGAGTGSNGDDDELEGGEGEGEMSNVRMVQLFLDTETQPEFMSLVEALNGHFETENPTDCVLAALREANERYSG